MTAAPTEMMDALTVTGISKMSKVFVAPKDLQAVDRLLREHKKIAAVKLVRANAMGDVGLREAKLACDRYQHEHVEPAAVPPADHWPHLATWNPIKRIVVDMGDGEMEVDLEEFQFKILSMPGGISVDSVGHLLDLLSMIREWEKKYETNFKSVK